MNVLKGAVAILLFASIFFYGIGVGLYKWFPFGALQAATRNAGGGYHFTSIADRDDLLIADTARTEIPCPAQTARVGVLVSFGQSNAANSAGYRYAPAEVPDVVNWYDGRCYPAQSPLLGATGRGGEWMSRTAQGLVDNGTYDKVVLLSLGIGGSPVAAWADGSELNLRLVDNLRLIGGDYTVTDMIWHQGETDANWGVSQSQYVAAFESLAQSVRGETKAPIFMSVASACYGRSFPNAISRAQVALVQALAGVEMGVDTDALIPAAMRHDGCHFTREGQETAALALAGIIAAYHSTK